VLWDIILMLHSVANSFGTFFALRFLLGTIDLHLLDNHSMQECVNLVLLLF